MSTNEIIETTPQEVLIKGNKVKVKTVMEIGESPPPPPGCPPGQCKDPVTGLCRLPNPDEIIGALGICTKIIPPENHPPVANAGDDKTVESGSLVTLDGSASTDPDPGDILSYKWQQTGGSNVILDTPNAKTARFIAPDVNIPPPPPPPDEVKLSPTSIVASSQDSGKEAQLVGDGNFETRWSADGDGEWIEFTFSQAYKFKTVKLTGYHLDRTYNFEIGGQQFSNPANRPANTLQEYNIGSLNLAGNKLRIIGHGNSNSTYNSYREIQVWGVPDVLPPPPDLTPVAVIVPENPTGQPGVTITVSGVNSKNASKYLWDVDGNLIIKDGIIDQPTAQIILPITPDTDLRVSLIVTNSLGQQSPKVMKVVTVTDVIPEQPLAKLSAPSNVTGGSNVVLDATGSIFDTLTFTQTAGPSLALQIIDAVKRQFTAPTGNFQLAFQLVAQKGASQAIAQVAIQVSTTPPPPPPPDGEVLWDSNIHLKTGQKYTITGTHGSQSPDGKGVFMAASGNPRLIVDADGTFHLEADSGHGRVYIKARNFNARYEGECMFEDNVVRNTTWRLRSRHNMGGDCANRFGGFGATCERAEQLAEYATESCHNNHENTVKKPLAKDLEVGKWFKFRYWVCNNAANTEVLFKTEYDYLDGNGWVTVLTGKHSSPQDFYMDEALYNQESYAWLRINNESTGSVAYKNVKIIKLKAGDLDSTAVVVGGASAEEKPVFAPKPIGEIKKVSEGLFFVDKPTIGAAADSNVILTFMLTVTDSKGATNTDLVNVTVTSGPPPPPPPGLNYKFSYKFGTQGNGNGQFQDPHDVSFDKDGNVFVPDRGRNDVQKFTHDGVFLSKFGGPGSGPGQFNVPYSTAHDMDNNFYVTDRENNRLQKLTNDGVFITELRGINGKNFVLPEDIAFDFTNGDMYMCDTGNNRIVKMDKNLNFIREWGSKGTGDGQFDHPHAIDVGPDRNVYISSGFQPYIQKFTPDGVFIKKWGKEGTGDGEMLMFLEHLDVDIFGRVHLINNNVRPVVQVWDSEGNYLTKYGSEREGSADGELREPEHVTTDNVGRAFVVDSGNFRIQVFTPEGIGPPPPPPPPPPPGDPIAVIKPDNVVGTVGLTTAVSGHLSQNTVSYLWTVSGTGLSIVGPNNAQTATLQMPNFIAPGLSVTLTVANIAGKTNSVTKPVTVVNIPPPPPPPPPPTGFNIISWGDDDTTTAAKRVMGKFMTEPNVSVYVHAGDGPYASRGTTWVNQEKTFFNTPQLVDKFMITQGNHEDEESETEQTQKDIEAWLPKLAITPEVAPNQQSWEKTSWLESRQVGNCFLIMLNSQDQDVEFKGRNQYNWVVKQLEKAKQLRDAGQVDWIICAVHKPHFTLKSSHSPYTAVRQVYREVFRQYQVDIMFHGHNHNYQMWKPMIAITGQDGNQAGQQLFTQLPDGTYDFSKDHGISYIVNGNGGHEHNGFNEDPTQNPNIIYANDEDFGYTKLEVNGKDMTVKAVHENGTVLHQYKITRRTS